MTEVEYIREVVKDVLDKSTRVYVNDPSEVPEGAEPQEGPQGGIYYERPGGGSEGDSDPETNDGEDGSSDPDADGEESGEAEITITETTPEAFAAGVSQMIEENPEMGAFLSEHPPEELEDHTLISTEDGGAGVAVSPEGDIQNLFNLDGPDGAGRELLQKAIEAGGNTLDCYDGFLPDLYSEYGFRETGRMEFNPDYAPEGWNFDEYGQPDVVFMAYQPEASDYEETDKYYEPEQWEQAKDESRREADNRHRSGEKGAGVRRKAQGSDSRTGAADRGSLTPPETTEDITRIIGDRFHSDAS